jgi:hypothetical protein
MVTHGTVTTIAIVKPIKPETRCDAINIDLVHTIVHASQICRPV